MKVFLAGGGWEKRLWMKDDFYDFYRLHTFHDIQTHEAKIIHSYKDFLLDSGAFTFLNKAPKKIDWNEYISNYANFINKYDVKYFFELDIDPIVGIKEVERLRKKLEVLTNKKSIPVWHKSRGLDSWKKICKDYDYIAIGGIVTKEITKAQYDIFIPLLKIAKENNCKVHGLGFTSLKGLHKYPFYSVDSTSWLSGNRFGGIYVFNGNGFNKTNKPPGKRVKTQMTANHNFYEWIKFQNYAEQKL